MLVVPIIRLKLPIVLTLMRLKRICQNLRPFKGPSQNKCFWNCIDVYSRNSILQKKTSRMRQMCITNLSPLHMHSRACGQLLCKFLWTEESVYIRKDPGETSSTPIMGFEHQNDRRLVLFWNTNMTVVTSYEDTLYRQTPSREKLRDKLSFQTKDLRSVLNSS